MQGQTDPVVKGLGKIAGWGVKVAVALRDVGMGSRVGIVKSRLLTCPHLPT